MMITAKRPGASVAGTPFRPKVTVIVPVRDDRRLATCLEALKRQTYPAQLLEVVVADNGSSREFVGYLARFRSITLVDEPAPGSYRARNAAVAASTGDVLAFTDADCIPDPRWIERSVAEIGQGADVVSGGIELFARGDRLHPIEAYELVHAFPQERYVHEHGAGVTANLVMTRAVFTAVGPFRGDLLSGADIEWGQRARASGCESRFVEAARVRHPARRSFREMRTKIARVVQGSLERRAAVPGISAWPSVRELAPPVGAARRARMLPGGRTLRNVVALVVGESFCRYISAWHHLRLLLDHRRGREE